MVDLIFVAYFQAVGEDFASGRAPAPFRQEMVNQSANPFGRLGENPHFANRCRSANVGSRIQRQRCRHRAAQDEAEQVAQEPAAEQQQRAEETAAQPNE